MVKRNKNEINPVKTNLNSEDDWIDDTESSQPRKQNRIIIRYKYAVGAFHLQRNLEDALIELRDLDFPMNQVYIVKNEASPLKTLTYVDVRNNFDRCTDLQISNEKAKRYQYLLARGEYLLVLTGTDIQMVGVKKIIENYGVRDFNVCNRAVE